MELRAQQAPRELGAARARNATPPQAEHDADPGRARSGRASTRRTVRQRLGDAARRRSASLEEELQQPGRRRCAPSRASAPRSTASSPRCGSRSRRTSRAARQLDRRSAARARAARSRAGRPRRSRRHRGMRQRRRRGGAARGISLARDPRPRGAASAPSGAPPRKSLAQLTARRAALEELERDRVGLAPGRRGAARARASGSAAACSARSATSSRTDADDAELAEQLLGEWVHAVLVRDAPPSRESSAWHARAEPGALVLLPVEPGPAARRR